VGADPRGRADPRIDRWLDKDRPWRSEMLRFREILLSSGLDEALKWRAPCYVAHDSNVAILHGLKDHCALGFFRGALIEDRHGHLEAPGPNSRSSRVVRVRSLGEIDAMETALADYVVQAVAIAREGRRPEMPVDEIDLPPELRDALAADAELCAAFEALTPGRRRGWALHVGGAKQEATRRGRIAKAAPLILAGKGMHDR
jgi:uncharacterized protein YdeI (YjbR/CyaY-like superfamily)